MLPTTILQWALNSVVCNFTCEFLVGTMGTTYLHLTWQSTIYKALSISTSAPGIHVITLATLKPMAIHGLCSMTLAHHAKCAAFAKFHPTNRSDSRVYLENIHGLKWHEAELQIDSGVSAVWSQNDNCQQQGEGFFQKKWWAYQLYQLVHRKLQLHLRVLAALSLVGLVGSMASSSNAVKMATYWHAARRKGPQEEVVTGRVRTAKSVGQRVSTWLMD